MRRHTALAVGAVLALATLAAGCGRSTSGPSGSNEKKVAAAASARDLLPARYKQGGVLKVVTSEGYPPMEMYRPGTRTLTGVDPDLAKAIADKLGLKLKLTNAAFDGLIPGIQGGRWDLAMSSLSDSAERRKAVDFVDYFQAGGSIMVKKGNPEHIRTLADLCGKKVVLAKGSSNLAIGQRQNAKCHTTMQISQSEDAPTGLLSIDTGRTVATIVDYPAGVQFAKSGKYELLSHQYDAGPWGIAVDKRNTGLRDAVTKAMQELLASGDYARLLTRYGVADNAPAKVTVNAA
jgi:polar amino acid transport system substrate-binding protein